METTEQIRARLLDEIIEPIASKALPYTAHRLDKMDTRFMESFYPMAQEFYEKTGRPLHITDTFRTYEEQADLKKRKPFLAASPGRSMHEKGLAMDIDTRDVPDVEKLGLLDKYGFHRPALKSKGETWHIEKLPQESPVDISTSMMVAGPATPTESSEDIAKRLIGPESSEDIAKRLLIDSAMAPQIAPREVLAIPQKTGPITIGPGNIGRPFTQQLTKEALDDESLRRAGIPTAEQEALKDPLSDPGAVLAAAVTGGLTAPTGFLMPALRTGLGAVAGGGLGDIVKDVTGSQVAGMATDIATGLGVEKSLQRAAKIATPKISKYLKGIPTTGEMSKEAAEIFAAQVARERAIAHPGFNPVLGKVRYQPTFKIKEAGAGYEVGDQVVGAPLQDAHVALREKIRNIRKYGGSADIKAPYFGISPGTEAFYEGRRIVYQKSKLGTLEPTEFIFNRAEQKLPGITDTILTPLRDAKLRVHQGQLAIQDEVDAIKASLPQPKKASIKIGKWLVNEQPDGAEVIKKMGVAVEPLTEDEMKVALKIRNDLKEKWFPAYNNARILAGKQPIKPRENYFTFSRAVSSLREEGFDPLRVDETVLMDKMSALTQKSGRARKTPFFPWIKRETSDIPLNFDAFGIYERYTKTAVDFIETAPEVAKIHTFVNGFTPDVESGVIKGATKGGKIKGYGNLYHETPNLARYLMDTANKAVGVQPPPLMGQFDKWFGKISNNTTVSLLGLGVRTALVQPAALVVSGAKAGGANTAWGIADAFSKSKANFALKHSKVLSTRRFDISFEDLLDEVNMTGGNYKKLQAASLKFMEVVDYRTALAGWWSGFRKAVNDGAKFSDAVNYADKLIVGSHASPMKLERAAFQSGDLGKALSGLQIFVNNEWHFLNREILGIRNPGMPTEKAVKRLATYIMLATVANGMYHSVGMESPLMQPVRAYKSAKERGADTFSAVTAAAIEPFKVVPFLGGYKYGKPFSVPVFQTAQELLVGETPGTRLAALAKAKGIFASHAISRFMQTEPGFNLRDYLARKTGMDRLFAPGEKQIPLTTLEYLVGRSEEEQPAPEAWMQKYVLEDLW